MTETTDKSGPLPEAVHQFVLQWGNLGDRWGVNRSVSQIHALLYASERPLTADDIAEALGMARSNVSNSIRELLAWEIIRSIAVLGDRRAFYAAETDLWTMVLRIAAGRKARELDPAAAALRQCVAAAEKDTRVTPAVAKRLEDMLAFVEQSGRWYDQMLALPRAQITALIKLGSGIARFLPKTAARKRAVGA
ncbi:MAG: GbsR/MarR family transcriptional regulator [Steroidobacteraceae bacterium]